MIYRYEIFPLHDHVINLKSRNKKNAREECPMSSLNVQSLILDPFFQFKTFYLKSPLSTSLGKHKYFSESSLSI